MISEYWRVYSKDLGSTCKSSSSIVDICFSFLLWQLFFMNRAFQQAHLILIPTSYFLWFQQQKSHFKHEPDTPNAQAFKSSDFIWTCKLCYDLTLLVAQVQPSGAPGDGHVGRWGPAITPVLPRCQLEDAEEVSHYQLMTRGRGGGWGSTSILSQQTVFTVNTVVSTVRERQLGRALSLSWLMLCTIK